MIPEQHFKGYEKLIETLLNKQACYRHVNQISVNYLILRQEYPGHGADLKSSRL